MTSLIPERFALVRTLREDRKSKTFVANDHELSRDSVIVKIIKKDHVAAERDQLVQHFSWLIGTQHRQFPTVFDAGFTKRQDLFCVREYLPPSGPLSENPQLTIKSLVSAVAFLSRHSYVHGAIKPSNIFVANGNVKLADAKPCRLGSYDDAECVHFTAPEILAGGAISNEGDLYSLGAVLSCLLTGRHLFEDPDLSRLKSKYLSASLMPAPYLSAVFQSISEIVLKLLSRNPADRPKAFELLKDTIVPDIVVADRAAFVGRASFFQNAVGLIEKSALSLQVLSVEGEVGIGKSRFVEELRLHCGFHGMIFVAWHCSKNSGGFGALRERLGEILKTHLGQRRTRLDSRTSGPALSEYITAQTSTLISKPYPFEKVVNDLISLMGSVARHNPMILTIEDIDLADTEVLQFLEQLTFRSSEVPLSLIVTRQPCEIEPKSLDTMASCLGTDFHRLPLSPLSADESLSLIHFFEENYEKRLNISRLSAGNPRFIESYSKGNSSLDCPPVAVTDAVRKMLSRLAPERLALLQVLSVFRQPVNVSFLRRFCGGKRSAIEHDLNAVLRLGFIRRKDDLVEIAYPVAAIQLYKSIQKEKKKQLNRDAFVMLRDAEHDIEVLSRHALEAGMLREAAALFCQLASLLYESQSFRAAQRNYEVAQECTRQFSESLDPKDQLQLARCYEWAGKQRLAHRVYRTLLSVEKVRKYPELLSAVYARLSVGFDNTPLAERVRLLELGIQCLPHDSPQLMLRYQQFLDILVRKGDLSRAAEILKKVKDYGTNHKESPRLHALRGTLLHATGNFRGAVESYSSHLVESEKLTVPKNKETIAMLNNLAVCSENLGELERALGYQSEAQRLAVSVGNAPLEILTMGNLAAMKMKMGRVREAEHLFNQARDGIKRMLGPSGAFDRNRYFFSLEADSVLYGVHTGEYALAADRLKRIRILSGPVLKYEGVILEIIRCKFLIAIGLAKKVPAVLRRFTEQDVLQIGFLQVERVLIEAGLFQIPTRERLEGLRQALILSRSLGTVYQQCELLISLASLHLELNETHEAEQVVKSALELANKNGYRLLGAWALLVSGLASEDAREKLHFLTDAFQQASEMGLQELIAESAYHIGITHLDAGNVVTAREYLIRSTSITARLSDGVPITARPKYLAKQWRRNALKVLDRCNESIPLHSQIFFNTESDMYFSAAYRFTMAAAAANSVHALLASVEKELGTSFKRSAVVVFSSGTESSAVPIRIKMSPELVQRIELIRKQAKNRVYFESLDLKGKQPIGWIPIHSNASEGGIYVACHSHESAFSEKEIEFLTMIGSIASSALRRLETRQAEESEPRELAEFHGMIGASKPIREVYSQIQMAAGNAATVMIEGESGTGKELVAKAIHAAGERAKQPFIAVDCGALPEGLIEAELFGAKKGSYTGAESDRSGLFEAANHGTIFLDEISNTTPALQAKLLRVIQEREVRRIGETKGRSIDVRLIVASNQSLESLAASGHFRKDLLYRLRVLHIKVPPLRNRREDIPMLAHAFLKKLNTSNKTKKYFGPQVIDHLSTKEFPGNVRELQNAIERGFFLAKGIMITEIPLDAHVPEGTPTPVDEVQSWFKDIAEGRKDFWSAIHNRYKHRDISREKVLALVDFGLRSTRGSYKTMRFCSIFTTSLGRGVSALNSAA